MNLIICPKSWGGVEYHRLIIPFKNIEDTKIASTLEGISAAEMKNNNISQVWYNRNICQKNNPLPILIEIRKSGAKIVIDIDDYWDVPYGHVLKSSWKEANIKNLYAHQIQFADYIVVTNQQLADTIVKELKVNPKKIIIAPNAIDPNENQYNQKFKYKLNELFWQGSVTHHHDLKQIAPIVSDLQNINFHMAGYDMRADQEWTKTEAMFKLGNRFKRIISTPCDSYMNGYIGKGLCLIPLENTKFNKHKSNLKLIESGWAKKPVIVSGIHPYLPLAKDGVNCVTAYSAKSWMKAIMSILNEPNFADDIRFQLYDDIKANYLIHHANKARIDLINYING